MLLSKDLIGGITIFICLIQYGPLIYLTLIGKKKPHFYSRLIWAIMFGITSLAQYTDNGGAGSWANGISGACCMMIALAALRNGNSYITKSDRISLGAAATAILLWLLTKNALWAVVLATTIDCIGYIPTFRKSWQNPHDEMISSFILGCVKQAISLFALENYSLITLFFPLVMTTVDIAHILVLFSRRAYLAVSKSSGSYPPG